MLQLERGRLVDAWFGVDIGGTQMKTALVDGTGSILHRQALDTHPERGVEDACERLKSVLRDSVRAIDINIAQVRSVGVGVAGFLDQQGVILEAPNLGWQDVALADQMRQVLAKPVAIDNDANVAALGEAWRGAGRDARTVFCVTVGTGVGAGIVCDGRIHSGATGMAGEIGHLVVDRDRPVPCGCGNVGCMETRASATAIVRDAKRLQAAGELPSDVAIRGAADVFLLAAAGHAAAQQVVRDAAGWLGYGLALCATMLNPDVILIGGGVSRAGAGFVDQIRASFNQYVPKRIAEVTDLRLAELGNDAGVVGAARLAGAISGGADEAGGLPNG